MLINQITSAFKDVTLEDGISLNMTEYYDCYETNPEFMKRARDDERENWQAISDATLEEFVVTFSFTDLKGFRFYIPAYMIWTVRNHVTSDNIIGDFTIYALDTGHFLFEDNPMNTWFTAQQLEAITTFLGYCIDTPDTNDSDVAIRLLDKIRTLS